jgi:hypothetical protein
MKIRFLKSISGMAFATVLSLAVAQISVVQSGQERREKEQRELEGVWDISLTVRSYATGVALFTGRVIHMHNDGGTMTEIADRSNRSTGLGTWCHLVSAG